MNKYLEKIARSSLVRSYSRYVSKDHDLVDTAIDIKGRAEDLNSLHSEVNKSKKKKKK